MDSKIKKKWLEDRKVRESLCVFPLSLPLFMRVYKREKCGVIMAKLHKEKGNIGKYSSNNLTNFCIGLLLRYKTIKNIMDLIYFFL